jgi:hypothetical protein
VDATKGGWAAAGGGYYRHHRASSSLHKTKVSDKTRLYGPGLVLGGVSTAAAGILVIPSFLMMNQGKTHRLWPRVVLLWKVLRVVIVVGFGLAVLASVVSIVT